jgi:preprotein translocase subunit SecF
VADLKEREPEQVALRRRVLARRSAAGRTGAAPVARAGQVASARRAAPARSTSTVALAERDLPEPAAADMVVESPSSVRPETHSGATAAPRPGARPQRPGAGRSPGKRRR